MLRSVSSYWTFFNCVGLYWLATVSPLPAQTGSLTIVPGTNVQAAVDAAPAGTTFLLTAGTYRMQSVKPKANDSFIGTGSVDFNGSEILTFKASGTLYVAAAKFDNLQHGECQPDYPLCGWDQDLFINNVLQTKATSKTNLAAGSWYFDHANNAVYLPANPEGLTVELSMTPYAFYGNAAGVKLTGIVVEKYANTAQTGAIGGDNWETGLGTGWSLQSVESRWNHGAGAFLGSGASVSDCYFHHNGQLGIKLTGSNASLSGSEIAWNNQQGFLTSWEAGGGKFTDTENLLVQSNYVHDNLGEGLWTDTDNIDTTYANNTVEDNQTGGIMHEVSYAAVIKNNTVSGNAPDELVWLENAQILIQNSSSVQVYGNSVEVPANGGNAITIVNQNRGKGAYGPYIAAYNTVHNNTITYLGATGYAGVADDTSPRQSSNNTFDYNQYVVQGGGTVHWFWYSDMTWSEMRQVAGQEAHGNCCSPSILGIL